MTYATVILVTAALFSAVIIHLAAKPRYAARLAGYLCFIAAVGGLLFYGYGFASVIDNVPMAIIRSLVAVCGMFVGKSELSAIISAPGMDKIHVQIVFQLLHFAAFYAIASATITSVGAEALRKLRLWLARRGALHLIYGVNADSISFARQLMAQSKDSVVFVDDRADLAAAVTKIGCVLRSDTPATHPDRRFLRSIGLRSGKRTMTVYALQKNTDKNLRYATDLLSALRDAGIKPSQTHAVILGDEDALGSAFQAIGDQYGYGNVSVYQEAELAARLLMEKYPVCDVMTFDENGKATSDLDTLIIGFGQVGQAVLRSLIMNGQFYGSTFHAAVFSPDCSRVRGYLSHSYGSMLQEYDISFYDGDGRSPELFDYVLKRKNTLKYIVVCIGDDKLSEKISDDLLRFLSYRGCNAPVIRCSRSGLVHSSAAGIERNFYPLYTPEILCSASLDRMAAAVNHHYSKGESVWSDWANCDYFSRMSSRAFADFVPAVLKAAGVSEEQALQQWSPAGKLLENLGKTEHLRWCAFHYAMGYSPMPQKEWNERAEKYKNGLNIRISKDTAGKQHACLIPWEELDSLSSAENRVTGKSVDYKAMDFENVLTLPAVIRAGRTESDC